MAEEYRAAGYAKLAINMNGVLLLSRRDEAPHS